MRRHVVHLLAATALAASVAVCPGGAQAADPVLPTATELATALGLSDGTSAEVTGDPAAFMITGTSFDDFPRRSPVGAATSDVYGQDGQYLVLSTGKASQLFDASELGPAQQPSTDLGAPDDGDTASLALTVPQAATNRCLLLDVAMATEERVHTYTTSSPSDAISLLRDGDPTQYAQQPGPQYFAQESSPRKPVDYSVNAINYWHAPGDDGDRAVGDQSNPWIDASATPFDHVTSVETMEVPLPSGQDNVVRLSISDANNDLLDSAALVDRVRISPKCSTASNAATGLSTQGFTIRGDRGVGNTLTVDPFPATDAIERYDDAANGWYAGSGQGVDLRFRWYRFKYIGGGSQCQSTDMSMWVALPDADRQSYVPTPNEKGYCLIVLVTGVKDGWRTETFPSPAASSWNPTLPIGNGVFVETSQPTINLASTANGTIRVGDTVSAKTGAFKPRQDTTTYQWYTLDPSNGAQFPISGATSADLVVAAAQAGKQLVVQATAQRFNFTDRAVLSAATSTVVPQTMTSTPTPTITGTLVAGQTVTASTGTWEPSPVTFTYQWYLDGQVLSSAKDASLVLRPDYAGKSISVAVSGGKAGYASVTKTSAAQVVSGAPMSGATPTISGTAKVGYTLTGGTAESWSPAGSTLTYIWKASNVTIQSGSNRLLVVPSSAVGKTITLTIQGTSTGYVTTSRTSVATAKVRAGSLTTSAALISGSARVGSTLRALTAAWRPSGVKLTYRWYRNGRAISGATRSTYKIPRSARRSTIRVKITGSRTGYTAASRTSASTARIR